MRRFPSLVLALHVVVFAAVPVAAPSWAAVALDIHRAADTAGIIAGPGSLPDRANIPVLQGSTLDAPDGQAKAIVAGSSRSGSVWIFLTEEKRAPMGGKALSARGVEQGRWQIVVTPIPPAAWLLLGGLGVLGLLSRRRPGPG